MSDRPRCAHLTKKGQRCKNPAAPGRLFCPHHDPELATSSKWAAAARAVREHPDIFGKDDS